MTKLSNIILKHKYVVLIFFVVLTIISLLLIKDVKINYNLSDYLPKDAKSLVALKEMSKSYSSTIPNIKIVIPNVSINEAITYKNKIKKIKHVNEVLWADNYIDLSNKAVTLNQLKEWYKDNNALFLISIDTKYSHLVINDIKNNVKKNSLMAGEAVNIASAQNNIQDEMNRLMIFAVPIILVILLLTTSSWFEPVLFLITIGVAIAINMGTNIIFGEISSITQAAAAILQLAVSMDYAIFLLHRFAQSRHNGKTVNEAMQDSVRDSASVIIASALTTIFGFLALVIMKFRIGPDLGFVLAKGIIFSLISVLTLLPVLAIFTYKIIDKTHHKSLIPSFSKIGKGIVKSRYAIMIITILLIIPCFIASQNNTFLYGSSGINSENSQVYKDTIAINKKFGLNNQMVLLIPVDSYQNESKLTTELKKINHVTAVNSFVTTFGLNTPLNYLPQDIVKQFISKKYSRIIIKTDVAEEGEEAFKLVDKVKTKTSRYYHNAYQLAGISVTNYDMKKTVTNDNLVVNILAIVSIITVLILMFKKLFLPLILIMTIETAIWINLSIAYLAGSPLNFIGFLIISTVQLGATVDYAILYAKKYLGHKDKMDNQEAAIATINETAPSILSSAGVLAIAGFGLGIFSTNRVISELGILVGRGAFISAIMVLLFLSSMFIIINKKNPR